MMKPTDWINQASQYVNRDLRQYKAMKAPNDLRTAVIDAHSTLENVLREYLVARHAARFVLDKSEINFPMLVKITQEKTAGRILNDNEAERLRSFSRLRNRIAHEKVVPTQQEAYAGLDLVGIILTRLLKDVNVKPAVHIPWGSLVSSTGWGLIVLAVLYFIFPDPIPGPVDDVIIGAPLVFVAWLLFQFVGKKNKGH